MQKIDLKKCFKHLYLPSAKEISVVDVPELKFLMVDGRIEAGTPPAESAAFHESMLALYGASYVLKFMSKLRKEDPVDYTVMALEGLWWVESGEFNFTQVEPWLYTLMMLQPDHVSAAMVTEAIAQQQKKKPSQVLDWLRLEAFREGLCLQTMHMGPYAEEPSTLARMKEFAAANNFSYRGKHHEIYIGDPRRSKPENLRTVLRQPVERLGSTQLR